MDKCINTKHPEFIELAKQVNMNPLVLKSKIGVWQEKNNSDDFPTLEELGIVQEAPNLGSDNNIKEGVPELFESNPDFANKVYEALVFKEQQYVSKLKEIAGRRKLATKSDLENSQLIKDLRVDKSQPKALKPNAADNNLAAIMLYGMKMSELEDKGLSEEMMEATTLAYRILNDFMFDMDELSFYEDILSENPEYAKALSTNENPVKEFFENDIFEQADKEKFEITPEQKQEAQKLYSQYLNTIFPDSKVKDIVYHGSSEKREVLDPTKQIRGKFGKGISFAPTISMVKQLIDNPVIHAAIIDLKNPLTDVPIKSSEVQLAVEAGNHDGVQVGKMEYTVPTKEQIHILGSQADIQGFKEFVQGKQYMVDNSETQDSKKENKVKPLADRKGVTYNDINNINVFC